MKGFLEIMEKVFREREKAEREIREAFVREFGVDPDIVTPILARKSYRIDRTDRLAVICDDIRKLAGYPLANANEHYMLILATFRDIRNDTDGWIAGMGTVEIHKVSGGFYYSIRLDVIKGGEK